MSNQTALYSKLPLGARGQRGFAFPPFLLANWQLIVLALLACSLFAYYEHCQSVSERYDTLVASLKAAAVENEKKVKAAIEQSRKDKERADEDHKRTVSRLNRDLKRLRDNPPAYYLPAPSPASGDPDRATVSRAIVNGALRSYREEVIGLLEEGDQGIAGLDSAKRWAQR